MNRVCTYSIVLVLLLFTSCDKDSAEPAEGFIKTIDTEASFFNRGLLGLEDGSTIVYGVAFEDVTIASDYGQTPSTISKFDKNGQQLWQKQLPEEVYEVWKGITLVNGDLIFMGLNSELGSEEIGLVKINADGEILQITSFTNPTNSIFGITARSLASMDIEPLNAGGFALAARRQWTPSNTPNRRIRLIIFDSNMSIVSDELHDPIDPERQYDIAEIELEVGPGGDIWLLTGTPGFTPALSPVGHELSRAAVMQFDGQTYERLSVARFMDDTFYSPKTLVFNSSRNPIWSAPFQEDLGQGIELYNVRNQEVVSIGRTIELRETNQEGDILNSTQVNGFNGRGYFHKGKRCDSGGFIFIGTSGISQNLSNPSLTKILLVRTDDRLSVQWRKEISTNRAALGMDVLETEGGFLVSGSSLSINEEFRMIFFKINGSGELTN